MKIKKRIKGLAVCMALCLTMLCGGVMVSHAVTPVCGGNHNYCKVRNVPRERMGDVYSHFHDGHICWVETWQDRMLVRCYCGREEVWDDGNAYLEHHIDYSH